MPVDRSSKFVTVRGARDHKLRNVNVDVPRDALVVFTGISGSGKSSLAVGTLYAEAQRRYFESVSPYARRLIDRIAVPDVDSIEGLPPAVALQQQRGSASVTPEGARCRWLQAAATAIAVQEVCDDEHENDQTDRADSPTRAHAPVNTTTATK